MQYWMDEWLFFAITTESIERPSLKFLSMRKAICLFSLMDIYDELSRRDFYSIFQCPDCTTGIRPTWIFDQGPLLNL